MNSLRFRFGAASALLLLVFVGVTGFTLERALQTTLREAQQDKMKGLVYAILGLVDTAPTGGLVFAAPENADPRLANPDSGLEAAIFDSSRKPLWASSSRVTSDDATVPEIGAWQFNAWGDDPPIFKISYGVRWTDDVKPTELRFTVQVKEIGTAYVAQLQTFRRSLWSRLVVLSLALLILELVILRWGLSPIRKFADQLSRIRQGDKSELEGSVPQELTPLSESLNELLRHERSQQKRFQNALGDLAHSLKTPLAAIKGTLKVNDPLLSQVTQMDQIVAYQLRKAATVGRRAFAAPVEPGKVVNQLVEAMKKVYAEKSIRFDVALVPGPVRMDEGDLMEILGNLIDNACKWSRSVVRIQSKSGDGYTFTVEDDGPGFPENAKSLMARGVRADNRKEGQGIGLSVVSEMVEIYEGSVRLGESPLGGALVEFTIPAT